MIDKKVLAVDAGSDEQTPSYVAGGDARRGGFLTRVGSRAGSAVKNNVIPIGIGAVLLWLIGGPLYFLVRMSLSASTSPVAREGFTLSNYQAVLSDPRTYSVLLDTIRYSAGVTVVSLFIAVAAAWLIERTDLPGRNLAWLAMLAPIAMPGILMSMAWVLLLGPEVGAINVYTRALLDNFGIELSSGPFNIYSMEGMIFLEGTRGATTLFLMIVGAFRMMDSRMEDAAALSGASTLQTLRRVTLPLLAPALFAAMVFAFLGNLQDFDTPLLLGLPAGIFILPTLIYFVAFLSPIPGWGLAAVYGSFFLVVMFILCMWYYRVVIRRARRFQTIVGKGYQPRRIRLGKWKPVAVGLFVVFFLVSMGLPLLTLVWTSLLPSYQPFGLDVLGELTLANFERFFTESRMLTSVLNSVLLGLSTATGGILIAFGVSWAVVRLRVRGSLLLDSMAFVPNAIPTVAVGLGYVVLYLSPLASWTKLYGTVLIMVLALMANYLAFATRLGNGAMAQLSAELEEQAWVAGHGKIKALTRVTLPLLLPTIVAGWVWLFAHATRSLTIPLMLGTRSNEVIALRLYHEWSFQGDITFAAAIGVVLLVVLLSFSLAARRVIVQGYTSE